jgi:hypothetical protein
VYSTYFGGNGNESGSAIAVDSLGSVYFAGSTSSANLPITAAAFQRSGGNAYLAKIAPHTFVHVTPAAITFNSQLLGTTGSSKWKITVKNNGTSALAINHVYVAGPDPASYAATSACGSALQPGKQCTISITFTPITIGNLPAAVVISDSDAANPQAVKLLGTGTEVELAPSSLNFGNQTVGTTSAAQSITLTNVGSTQMKLTSISLTGSNPGDFSETNTCGSTVAARGSCTITVKFTPMAVGARSATVSIKDNGGGSPQKVTLSGTGT